MYKITHMYMQYVYMQRDKHEPNSPLYVIQVLNKGILIRYQKYLIRQATQL